MSIKDRNKSDYFSEKTVDDSFDVPVEPDESYFFGVMETIFVGWFTFIFITRLLMTPDKVRSNKNNNDLKKT